MAEPGENYKAESDNKHHPCDQMARYFPKSDVWTAIATIFLVIVGIWGVIETKAALELTQRAWLSPTGAQLIRPPEKDDGLVVSFMNSGREPAVGARFHIQSSTIDALLESSVANNKRTFTFVTCARGFSAD